MTEVNERIIADPSPDSMDSALFAYDMDDPNVVEPWGQGLSVPHNPRALISVPVGFFPHANEHHLTDGGIAASTDGWHPFNSTTVVLDLGKVRKDKFFRALLGHGPRVVAAIPKPYFWSFDPLVELDGEEDGWYADEFESFLGLVLRREKDWKAIVFARDYHFRFFPIAKATGISSRLGSAATQDDGIPGESAEALRRSCGMSLPLYDSDIDGF